MDRELSLLRKEYLDELFSHQSNDASTATSMKVFESQQPSVQPEQPIETQEVTVKPIIQKMTKQEAVAKALGAPAGLSWQDCEILLGDRGKPYLEVSGTVLKESQRQGITNWHLSLSHDGNIATAFVIAEKQ